MSSFILKYRCWQLSQEASDGFTLLELLVTIIILGILSAIALPSMLGQSLKAQQAVAQSYIGSVNRAQQVYRLEFPVFANTMSTLGIDIPLNSDNYTFRFGTTNSTLAEFEAQPQNNDLNAFTGCTIANVVVGTSATTSTSIIEQTANGTTPATPPNC